MQTQVCAILCLHGIVYNNGVSTVENEGFTVQQADSVIMVPQGKDSIGWAGAYSASKAALHALILRFSIFLSYQILAVTSVNTISLLLHIGSLKF